jgi:chromosome segregation ATPase
MRHDDAMHSRRSVTFWAGAAVLLAVGLVAGCGDDGPSTEEATAEVCDARENVDEELVDVSRLDPTDADDLNQVRDDLADEVDELDSAGQELAEAEWEDVENAVDQLRDTIADFDADTEFGEANQQLSEARDQLTEAWDAFVSGVDCG